VKVEFTTKYVDEKKGAAGSLIVSVPGRAHFDVTYDGSRYEMTTNKGQGSEVNHASKIYREIPVADGAFGFESKISGLNELAFPWEVIIPELKMLGPSNAKVTKSPGVFEMEYPDVVGLVKWRFEIDAAGRPSKTVKTISNQGKTAVRETIFTKYTEGPKVAEDSFKPTLPDGYIPYSLPDPRFAILIGEKLDVEGWSDASGKSLASTLGGKPALLLLTAPGSAKGAALAKAVTGLGAPLLTLSTGRAGAQFKHKSGSAPYEYWAGGTPLLLLVDKAGVLEQAWIGQGSDLDPTTVQEVKKLLAELAATPK